MVRNEGMGGVWGWASMCRWGIWAVVSWLLGWQ